MVFMNYNQFYEKDMFIAISLLITQLQFGSKIKAM